MVGQRWCEKYTVTKGELTMRQVKTRKVGTIIVAAFASAVMLAGCTSSADGNGGGGSSDGAAKVLGDQGDGGDAQSGGTLSYAVYGAAPTLDPASRAQPAGTTGGTEMAAVYDLLMRLDSEKNEFVPQLADSMTESDDGLTWTMKLRDGVKFNDGSDLTADSVVWSLNRFNEMRGGNSEMYTANVEKTEAVDGEVKFTMKQRWSAFPAMFAFGHGMVVGEQADAGEQFAPIGAGAFTLESLKPQELTVLKANADYWDGKPNLDEIRIVSAGNDQARLDALNSGDVDMSYLRNAGPVSVAKDQFPGFIDPTSAAMVLQINSAPGKPGEDPRVRQAIALAVSPEEINQRGRAGEGMPGSELFQDWSQWHNDVAGLETDTAKAAELVTAAKADGFDGKMKYILIAGDPDSQAIADSTQAQMNAVGFEVELDTLSSVPEMVQRLYADKDFEMAFGSYSLNDAAPEIRLFSALNSTSSNNILGYNNPAMDELLAKIQAAPSTDDKVKLYADLQTMFNDEVPYAVLGAGEAYVAWDENVYGVNPSLDGILLLDKAWVKK